MENLIETAFDHLKGNETFSVTAAETWSIAMIRRLKKAYPDQVEIIHTNKDGSMLAHLPFEWMRIVPKRQDILTDEQRQARSEQMKALNSTRHRAVAGETSPISDENPSAYAGAWDSIQTPEKRV